VLRRALVGLFGGSRAEGMAQEAAAAAEVGKALASLGGDAVVAEPVRSSVPG